MADTILHTFDTISKARHAFFSPGGPLGLEYFYVSFGCQSLNQSYEEHLVDRLLILSSSAVCMGGPRDELYLPSLSGGTWPER